jgi:hypothetical protein
MLKVVEKQDAREAAEELLPLDEIAHTSSRSLSSRILKSGRWLARFATAFVFPQ